MGKKKTTILGSENEEELKAKKSVKLEQKKLREGKTASKTNEAMDSVNPVMTQEESPSKSKKTVHARSKAYKSAKSSVSVDKVYSVTEGLQLLRKVSLTKFTPTVELHITLKKAPDGKIVVSLPHVVGKAKRVAIADDTTIAKIESGTFDFDVLVASPAQMAKLVKFAKTLGPKGLMPNPKNGTVSDKPEEAAKKLAADTSTTLKLDKTGPVIHTSVGKLSLEDQKLEENIKAIFAVLPSNLKKAVLKSTMSPAIKIQA